MASERASNFISKHWNTLRNVGKGDDEVNKEIARLFKATNAYDTKFSNCSFGQLFVSPNDPVSRTKRWIDEAFYIVEVNKIEKLFALLSFALMILTAYISISCFYNKFDVRIVPKTDDYNHTELNRLNFINSNIATIVKGALTFAVSSYTVWKVWKRTTRACRKNAVATDG